MVWVMMQYLTERLNDEVRGKGLAYDVRIDSFLTEGRILLNIYRSARLAETYKVVMEILKRYIDNEDEWDEVLLDSAKGSIIYRNANQEETVGDLVWKSMQAYLRKTQPTFNRELVASMARVKISDIIKTAGRILPGLLSPIQTAIVCNQARLDSVVTQLTSLGIEVTKVTQLEESFLAEL